MTTTSGARGRRVEAKKLSRSLGFRTRITGWSCPIKDFYFLYEQQLKRSIITHTLYFFSPTSQSWCWCSRVRVCSRFLPTRGFFSCHHRFMQLWKDQVVFSLLVQCISRQMWFSVLQIEVDSSIFVGASRGAIANERIAACYRERRSIQQQNGEAWAYINGKPNDVSTS